MGIQFGTWRAFQLWSSVDMVLDIVSILISSSSERLCSMSYLCVHAFLLILALWSGWRSKIHSMLAGTLQTGAKRAAASVAGLLGDCSPDEVLVKSRERFRCVLPRVLRAEDMRKPDPDPFLYVLSKSASLGSCDAFVSHSWSDDADAKWAVLQEWCASFRAQHGREPSLWIDKFCINQADVGADLQCLPVFMCGCKELLVLSGITYFSRLWCIIELFTHHHAGSGNRKLTVKPVLRADRHDEDLRSIASTVRHFHVETCTCSSRRDRNKMIEIIEAAYGSSAVFSDTIRDIMVDTAMAESSSDDDTWTTVSFSREASPCSAFSHCT